MMFGSLMKPATAYEVDTEGRTRAEKYWMYGPETDGDTAFWDELAEAWGVDTDAALLQRCGNCDYFDNRVSVLKALNAPAGTGFCTKFDFLCAEEKSCQMWCCDNDYELNNDPEEY